MPAIFVTDAVPLPQYIGMYLTWYLSPIAASRSNTAVIVLVKSENLEGYAVIITGYLIST